MSMKMPGIPSSSRSCSARSLRAMLIIASGGQPPSARARGLIPDHNRHSMPPISRAR